MLVHSDNVVTVGYGTHHSRMRLDGTLCLSQKVSRWASPQLASLRGTWLDSTIVQQTHCQDMDRLCLPNDGVAEPKVRPTFLNQLINVRGLTVLSATELIHKDLRYLNKE